MKTLPPIDFKDLAGEDGHLENTEVEFPNCKHKTTNIIDGELKCLHCPAAWTGPRLQELQQLLANQK